MLRYQRFTCGPVTNENSTRHLVVVGACVCFRVFSDWFSDCKKNLIFSDVMLLSSFKPLELSFSDTASDIDITEGPVSVSYLLKISLSFDFPQARALPGPYLARCCITEQDT